MCILEVYIIIASVLWEENKFEPIDVECFNCSFISLNLIIYMICWLAKRTGVFVWRWGRHIRQTCGTCSSLFWKGIDQRDRKHFCYAFIRARLASKDGCYAKNRRPCSWRLVFLVWKLNSYVFLFKTILLLICVGAAQYACFPSLLKQLVGPLSLQLADRRSSIVKQVCIIYNAPFALCVLNFVKSSFIAFN